ncbi:MAG: magnesium/cobalt efflux protein [Rhodospirillaceae bacterium]|nr:magnesium/cobalt efflux protein [Rhodospirillaceae bacterium]|tara:strand:+ start:10041 stop:10964 length:924 start_codon:yes stop_codon:yes gene_type:complete
MAGLGTPNSEDGNTLEQRDHVGSVSRVIKGWWRKFFFRSLSTGGDLRDTIEGLIEEKEGAGELPASADELTLLKNILNLHGLTVYDIMVPRVDITAVDIGATLAELVGLMSDEAHSRIPVYNGTLDDIAGMIHIKDVLESWTQDRSANLAGLVRPVLFVAPSTPILELLLQMRSRRVHMALVVDEFGGIDGLATIEDLVEEIVGEIEDEHDENETPHMVEHQNGSVEVDARVQVLDFEKRMGEFLNDNERAEDIDTLGGLVFFLAGRVPAKGEIIKHSSGLEFEILEADPRRIRSMRITNALLMEDS